MTAATEAPAELPLVEPGVYPLTLEQYHADPLKPIGGSLSSSGARKLVPPKGCPALFRYEQDNPQPPKKTFDIGTAAHKLVLGDGPDLVLVDAPRWDTNTIKAEITAIRAEGSVPLKRAEYDQVHAMAAALRQHPQADRLLEPGSGDAEQSLLWQDPGTGVWRRARPDWLSDCVVDFKTTTCAEPLALQKAIYDYGYHAQADWYLEGARTLGLVDDHAPFYLIFQEKTPPYIVTVVQPDYTALTIGHQLNATALHLYAMCRETGHWPGYSEHIELIALPAWVERLYS